MRSPTHGPLRPPLPRAPPAGFTDQLARLQGEDHLGVGLMIKRARNAVHMLGREMAEMVKAAPSPDQRPRDHRSKYSKSRQAGPPSEIASCHANRRAGTMRTSCSTRSAGTAIPGRAATQPVGAGSAGRQSAPGRAPQQMHAHPPCQPQKPRVPAQQPDQSRPHLPFHPPHDRTPQPCQRPRGLSTGSLTRASSACMGLLPLRSGRGSGPNRKPCVGPPKMGRPDRFS